MKNLGLIAIILSAAALIGLAYTQNLYREVLKKINEMEKKTVVSKDVNNKLQSPPSNIIIPHPIASPKNSTDNIKNHSTQQEQSLPRQQTDQKPQLVNPETEKFYTMFKDSMKRYNKEMAEKYKSEEWSKKHTQNRLNRYKKKLNINDIQWPFIEPILTEYLQKQDELWQTSWDPDEGFAQEDLSDYWQKVMEKQKILKEDYTKKLSPHLTSQQIDEFKKMDSFTSGGIIYGTIGSPDNDEK